MDDSVSSTKRQTVSSSLPPGTELDHYRIIKRLGKGGFGITYLAEEKLTQRLVVIKENFPGGIVCRDYNTQRVVPDGEDMQNAFEWARRSFLQEACTLNQLKHNNIVTVLSVFEANNTVYFTMPYLKGVSLATAYSAQSPIREEELVPLLRTLLGALQHLHEKELTHRDIKPDNILITEENTPVLIDFGAARRVEGARAATQIGTPGFAPPEQLSQTNYDAKPKPRIDLYALGGTCYYLMTGKVPDKPDFRVHRDTVRQALNSPQLQKRYSPTLLASIEKSLQLKPEERWQTAAEWLAALGSPSSTTPQPVLPLPKKKNRKELVAAVLALALAGGIYVATQDSDAEAPTSANVYAQPPSDSVDSKSKAAIEETSARKATEEEAARKATEEEAARKAAEEEAARKAAEEEAARKAAAEEAARKAAEEEAARKAAEEEAARKAAEEEAARKATEEEAARITTGEAPISPSEKAAKAAAGGHYAPGWIVKVWPGVRIDEYNFRPHNPGDFGAATVNNSSAPIDLEDITSNTKLKASTSRNSYAVEWSGFIYVPEAGNYALQVKSGATKGSYSIKVELNDSEIIKKNSRRYSAPHEHTASTQLSAGYNPVSIFISADRRCNDGKFELALRKSGALDFTPLTPAEIYHEPSFSEVRTISTAASAGSPYAPGLVVKVWPGERIDEYNFRPRNPGDFGVATVNSSSAPIDLETITCSPELKASTSRNSYAVEWSGFIYVPEDGNYALQVKSGATAGSYSIKVELNDSEIIKRNSLRYSAPHEHTGCTQLSAGFNPVSIFISADRRCNNGKFELALRQEGNMTFTPLTPAGMYHEQSLDSAQPLTTAPSSAHGYTPGMVVKVWHRDNINQFDIRPSNPDAFSAAYVNTDTSPIKLDTLAQRPQVATVVKSRTLYGVEWSGYIYVPEDGDYALQIKSGVTNGSYGIRVELNDNEIIKKTPLRYSAPHEHTGCTQLSAGFNPVSIFISADPRCDSGKMEIGIRKASDLNFTPLTPSNFYHE